MFQSKFGNISPFIPLAVTMLVLNSEIFMLCTAGLIAISAHKARYIVVLWCGGNADFGS